MDGEHDRHPENLGADIKRRIELETSAISGRRGDFRWEFVWGALICLIGVAILLDHMGFIADGCQGLLIPPLLLQPLLENAITHGIANLPEGGCVRLAAHCHDGVLSIIVENTFDPEATSIRRNGMGLENVRQRLEARYAKLANMRVSPDQSCFQVSLSLPAETQEVAC
jgi:hypothetical protein